MLQAPKARFCYGQEETTADADSDSVNYKKALELLGPDFDAADYKVTGASYLRLMFLMKFGTNYCYSPANHPLDTSTSTWRD
ncbi:hypothetical protein Bca4012_071561 [Brassica carinata]